MAGCRPQPGAAGHRHAIGLRRGRWAAGAGRGGPCPATRLRPQRRPWSAAPGPRWPPTPRRLPTASPTSCAAACSVPSRWRGPDISSAYQVRRMVAGLMWSAEGDPRRAANPEFPSLLHRDPDLARIVRRSGGTIAPGGGRSPPPGTGGSGSGGVTDSGSPSALSRRSPDRMHPAKLRCRKRV